MISDAFWKSIIFQLNFCKHFPLLPLPFTWNSQEKLLQVRTATKCTQSLALTLFSSFVGIYSLYRFFDKTTISKSLDQSPSSNHVSPTPNILLPIFTLCFSVTYIPTLLFGLFFAFNPVLIAYMFNNAVEESHTRKF